MTLFKNWERLLKTLTQEIAPFWKNDMAAGEDSFKTCVFADGREESEVPLHLIMLTRILWFFSALTNFSEEKNWLKTADKAYRLLKTRLYDAENKGFYWSVDDTGNPVEDKKQFYGQAFAVYALSEYYMATKNGDVLELCRETFDCLETHALDGKNGGYREASRADWGKLENTALSEVDIICDKSMNTNLHVLEAYTNYYRIVKEEPVKKALADLIDRMCLNVLDQSDCHFRLYFNDKWETKENTVSYGHDIEGSWLIQEALEVLGEKSLLERYQSVVLEMAEVVLNEGMDGENGLFYEGRDGVVIEAQKDWWPQAEAAVGFINAFEMSGEDRYRIAAENCIDFIYDNLIIKEKGEWYWGISPDGMPIRDKEIAGPWKAPYHNGRFCMEALRRIKKLSDC